MSHIFSDCFKIYKPTSNLFASSDFQQIYMYAPSAAIAGSGDDTHLRMTSNIMYRMPSVEIAPVRDIVVSTEYKLQSLSGYSYLAMLGVGRASDIQEIYDGSLAARMCPSGVNLSFDAGVFYVTHTIRTDPANIVTSNNLIIAEVKPGVKTNTRYALEMRVTLDGAASRVIVMLNGAEIINVTFDENRLDTGLQANEFTAMVIGTQSHSSSDANLWYHIFAYKPDAEYVFPMGPVEFEVLRVEGKPAMDTDPTSTTSETFTAAAYEDMTIEDGLLTGKLLHTYSEIRIGAEGVRQADADIKFSTPGKPDTGQVVTLTPGDPDRILRLVLPSETETELDGITLSVRSAPQVP